MPLPSQVDLDGIAERMDSFCDNFQQALDEAKKLLASQELTSIEEDTTLDEVLTEAMFLQEDMMLLAAGAPLPTNEDDEP